MKILVIMGSPRKGDSYKITKVFEEKMNALDKVQFKYIFLKELNLEYCTGCCLCMIKGEEFCPVKDITLKLREEMLDSDGVFFISPVYGHQVTALMKNFIDHLSYIFHRPCFFDKFAMVISTTGGSGLKEVLDYLEKTASGWGFNIAGRLGVIAPAFQYRIKYKNKLIKEIEIISRKLYNAIKTGVRSSPTLDDLIFFRSMKCKMKNVREYYPCDYLYWEKNGWFNKEYFFEIKINLFKKTYLKFIESRIKNQMSKSFK